MRVSDWSSDVCSSDLLRQAPRELVEQQRLGGGDHILKLLRIGLQIVKFALPVEILDIGPVGGAQRVEAGRAHDLHGFALTPLDGEALAPDRKSTRLNSSH